MSPGDHCDFFFIFDSPQGKYTGGSFKNKLVLAVPAARHGVVTIALNPTEAVNVVSALAHGEPFVTVRSRGDWETFMFIPVRLEDILLSPPYPLNYTPGKTTLWTSGKIWEPREN